ncbi:MAG TPA: NAD-dependent 4,6-dehydratase LegB [Victivallales bacterium]|nr:NAD-dependent 4,6-dehydratase LegB [Victivallales bacterium]
MKKKKVLVTGADGFIGSHLVEMLLKKGFDVRATALYNSFNNWGWLEDIKGLSDVDVVVGDICNPHFCRKATEGIDVIFHLAALIAIPYSYSSPSCYIETNVKGTFNICQAALDNKCEKIIHTSTSEVYGTAIYVPIDEKHPLQPQSPYSASKIGADAIASSFFNSFGLPLVIARPFNTYGPRQSARAVIPSIITQIAAGKKEIKLGNVSPTRDFNYVDDTCDGFIRLAECKKALGETVNIGSGTEISVADTFDIIRKLMKSSAKIEGDRQRLRPDRSEVFRLSCDNTKIRRLTGFKPRFSIEQGLERTISWFTKKQNLSRYKTDIYNV